MYNFLSLIGIDGYREGTIPPEENLVISFEDGGLGDHICRLTPLKYIIDKYPFVKLTVCCPEFFKEFGKKAIPEINWVAYDEADNIYASQPIIRAGSNNGVTSLRTHLVDHAFSIIVDEQPSIEHKNYIKLFPEKPDFDLSKNYVILTTGHTVKVREFKPSVINQIIDYLKTKEYEIIFLGNEKTKSDRKFSIEGKFSEEINYSKGIDLRNKTTLLEAQAIITYSRCIIGVDNGLLHLAGTTNTPIVAGYTTVAPEHRMPIRFDKLGWGVFPVIPKEDLKCRFCQSQMNYVYDHDFRNCYYKDLACIKQQNFEDFKLQIDKALCIEN